MMGKLDEFLVLDGKLVLNSIRNKKKQHCISSSARALTNVDDIKECEKMSIKM
jgi:hypothetical protein